MRYFIDPPLSGTSRISQFRRGDYLFTVVVKLSLALAINGICRPSAADRQVGLLGPMNYDDDVGNSLYYAGDDAPFKPRTDVTLKASGYTPTGHQAQALSVAFGVGSWRKSLQLVGDRECSLVPTVTLTPPKPLQSLPIRLEYAFGGPGSPFNPWGKGYGTLEEVPGTSLAVANIHPEEEQHIRWDKPKAPAGFGPLPGNFEPRLARGGTYDEDWIYKRRPLPPEDFDFRHYNAAPDDQQFFPFLLGNETLFFQNLSSHGAQFQSHLPNLGPRVLLRRLTKDAAGHQLEELRPVLDTLHIDMDAMRVDLAWRAVVASQSADGDDISHVYCVLEQRDHAKPPGEHAAAFALRLNPTVAPPDGMAAAGAKPGEAAEKAAKETAQEAALLSAFKKQMGGLPLTPPMKTALEGCTSMRAAEKLFEDELLRLAKLLKVPV